MAYIDNKASPNRVPTLVGVALIHVAVIYALISGLAVDVVETVKTKLAGEMIEDPPAEMPLPPPPPKTQGPVVEPLVVPSPKVDLTPTVDIAAVIVTDLPNTRTSPLPALPIPAPLPSAAPAPQFTPKAAVPRGAAGDWVTTDDYPTRPLRRDQEGTTGFRLTIDTRGRVSDCTITSSSGVADLDQATCKYLTRRARFEAATGPDGKATTGSYTSRILWRIPD